MRVLLDEHLPRVLTGALPGHEARTVPQMGWAGIDNGELIRLARDAGFDVLLTMDRSIEYQRNIARAGLGLVVLLAPSNRVEHVMPLVPEILAALVHLRAGQVIHVGRQ